MASTRLKGGGGAKCHGPFICLQLRYGTLTARVRRVRVGGGGVDHYHLQWQMDGFFSWAPLRVSLQRLGHVSSRVLCLYESIKDFSEQRSDASNRAAYICHC